MGTSHDVPPIIGQYPGIDTPGYIPLGEMMSNQQLKLADFKNDLLRGDKGEAILDKYYQKYFIIKPVTAQEQRLGIDRIYTHKLLRYCYSVEYKTDFRAHQTGNVFIETWSDKGKKRGWATSSLSQMLVYYVPGINTAYQTTMLTIKSKIAEWLQSYNEISVQNNTNGNTWASAGLAIPIPLFEKLCHRKDTILWEP